MFSSKPNTRTAVCRPFLHPGGGGKAMRKVLHVGPCDTPGGMATVMHTLADHPPEGWVADLLPSHMPGGLWSKWCAYRRARRELKRRCSNPNLRPDVVHVHTAADWSWRRKSRLIQEVQSRNIAVVIHFHSGQFDAWLAKGGARRAQQVKRASHHPTPEAWSCRRLGRNGCDRWLAQLKSLVIRFGPERINEVAQDDHHLLLLARKDPVKGHGFAVKVAENLRQEFPNLRLTMTGESRSEHDWVHAVGWVSDDEKTTLLARASILLLPSAFEGQPMAALEALSAGLPVCVSDRVVGLPATVKQARWDDVEAWTAAVREMLHRPTEASTLQSSVWRPHD